MPKYRNIFAVDLANGEARRVNLKTLHQGDKYANRVGAIVTDNGVAVDLGGTCSAFAVLGNGLTVPMTNGVVSGNLIYCDLIDSCYAVEGPIEVKIKWTDGTEKATILSGQGYVSLSETDTPIDPGDIIPSVEALIDAIEEAEQSIPQDYSDLSANMNALTHFDLPDSGYINSSGAEVANSDYHRTGYIPVNADSLIILNGFYVGSTSGSAYAYYFYTSDKTPISGANGITTRTVVDTIPGTAAYIRFSSRISQGETPVAYVSNHAVQDILALSERVDDAKADVTALKSAFEDQVNFYSSTSLIDFSTSNISWYIDGNGLWQMNSAKKCGLYQVPSHAYKLVVVANSTSAAVIAFLKSDTKADDTSADFATGETGYHLIAAGETETFYLPADCTYIYVSKTSDTTDDRVPDSCTLYVRKEIPAVDTTLAISGAAADAKTVGDVLAQYELDTEKSINLFDMQYANYGYYINTSGGGLVSRADHFYAYIPITASGTYRYYNDSTLYGTTSAKKIVIYDSSKQYKTVISATHFGDGTGDWYGVEFTISASNISSGYAYFGISQHIDNIQRFMVVKDIEYPSTYYPYFAEREVFTSLNTKIGHALGAVSNKLFGKIALFFGDSICNGSSADDNKYGWAGRIGLGNEMTWRNFGQNGATICTQSGRSSISTQVSNAISEFASPDYAIIEGGTNDADLNAIALGTYTEDDYSGTYDTTTFSGAFETLIYNCLTNWPHAKIGYIVAQKMGRSADARAERKEFFDRAMAICMKWGIPYLNLWDHTPLNPVLGSMYDSAKTNAENIAAGSMYVDGQHLTPDGYDYLSPIIEHWMRGL